MSFPRYPAYKDSGVEWLGQVPTHWDVARLRRYVVIAEGQVDPEAPDYASMPLIAPNHIEAGTGRLLDLESAGEQGAESGKYLCMAGDVVYSKIRPSLRKVCVAPKDCLCSADMYPLRAHSGLDNPFLAWFLLSEQFSAVIVLESQRVAMPKVNRDSLNEVMLVVPSLEEQTKIVGFLARETSQIDNLIAEQLRLMDLLKEKRQSVISQTVTKGLNPDAPLKPSGIDWLGDVPSHWVATPLKWLTDPDRPIMYGIVLPGPDVGDGVPILKGGNVRPSRMRLDAMARTTTAIEAPYARARLKPGDLVYSIRGSIGDCELVPSELAGANITQDVARIAPSPECHGPWARWVLLSSAVREELASGSLGAAVRGVNIFDLKRVVIPTPPHAEQVAIAQFLDAETAGLDHLIFEADRLIALLQERRTAIISAAVTGQIDVRGPATSEVG